MTHCTHFAEPTLPCQSFRRPFNPAASPWHRFLSSWEQQVFIGFGISRILVVTCLTFNSEIPAKAASSPSLTSAINCKLRYTVWLLNPTHRVFPESHNFVPPVISRQRPFICLCPLVCLSNKKCGDDFLNMILFSRKHRSLRYEVQ